jgi:hypothetical protein
LDSLSFASQYDARQSVCRRSSTLIVGLTVDAARLREFCRLGFGAWRIACDKNKPAAPDALKVMCAKNFSTPAKFGIMPEVSEND